MGVPGEEIFYLVYAYQILEYLFAPLEDFRTAPFRALMSHFIRFKGGVLRQRDTPLGA